MQKSFYNTEILLHYNEREQGRRGSPEAHTLGKRRHAFLPASGMPPGSKNTHFRYKTKKRHKKQNKTIYHLGESNDGDFVTGRGGLENPLGKMSAAPGSKHLQGGCPENTLYKLKVPGKGREKNNYNQKKR